MPRPALRALGLAAAVLLAALPLARLLFFRGPILPPAELPATPIIDLHCHAAGIGAGDSGCFISPALRSNFRFRIYLGAFGVTEDELRRHGDSLLLDRLSARIAESRRVSAAVVLALDGVIDAEGRLDTNRTEVYLPNEFIERGARSHSNLLYGASINPYRRDALERLDDCARHGAVLVKWIPSIMEIDPADSRLVPFYRRMREHGLILLSHTGPEHSFTRSHDELADPLRLRLPLEQGVTVLAAHAGAGGSTDGESHFDRLRRLMREFPNLHADISALTQVNRPGVLETVLADASIHDRLVYGTDFPLINTALVSPWYFPLNLTFRRAREIAAMNNPWDRDLTLKQSLGVPAGVFARGAALLARPGRTVHGSGSSSIPPSG